MNLARIWEYLIYTFTPSHPHRLVVDIEIAEAALADAVYHRERYQAAERLYRDRLARLRREQQALSEHSSHIALNLPPINYTELPPTPTCKD